LWQQVLMGRFVTLALRQKDQDKRRVEQLERACAHLTISPLRDVAPYMMLVSSIFLACFLLDMAADTQGPNKASWAPLLLVSIAFLAWLKNKIEKDDENEANKARSRQQTEVEMIASPPRGIIAEPV